MEGSRMCREKNAKLWKAKINDRCDSGDDSEGGITGCKLHSKVQQQHKDTHHAVDIMDYVNKLRVATNKMGADLLCLHEAQIWIYLCFGEFFVRISGMELK